MQRNLYFRTMLQRRNVLKTLFLDFFLGVASYPRLALEVFIRKNPGQRYFSWASVLTVTVIMCVLPLIGHGISSVASRRYNGNDSGNFWTSYASWYIFIAAFLYCAWRRGREVKLNSSIFDFSRFSLYSGNIHPFFRNIKINGRYPSIRVIETLIEPAIFFLSGIVLYLVGQNLGLLLMVSALAYSFSYMAAYRNGDNFIMDKIDEMILNEELGNAFVEDLDGDKTRGVRFYMDKPGSKAMREKLAPYFFEGNDDPVTIAE